MRRLSVLLAGSAVACAAHTTPSAGPTPAARPAAAASARDPSAIRYAEGTGRYHAVTEVAQDAMGQAQTFDTQVYFSTALSASGASVGAVVTIDSMTSNAPGTEGLAGLRGRTVSLVFSPTGQPVTMTASDTADVALMQAAEGMRELLPRLPNGPIAAGATWTDTVVRSVPAPDVNLTMTLARVHRVVGWEDHDGIRALHLSSIGTYTMTGTGQTQGQTLAFTGSGRNQAQHFVSAAGVYLGSIGGDTADVNVNVASAGMQVTVHRTQHSTVTRLP